MELTEIQNERYCRSMMCDGFSQAEQAKFLSRSATHPHPRFTVNLQFRQAVWQEMV
jgi:hypothetical protein